MPRQFRIATATALIACSILAFMSPAQADALADIKRTGVVNMGVFEDFPPFSSVGTDMSLHGYDVDFANAVAKSLGVKVKLVPVTGQNRIPALQSHKVDVLLSVGQSAEREKVIGFTAAYAPCIAVLGACSLKVGSLKVGSAADLAGKTVAVNRGTLEDTSLTDAAPPTTDIRRFDNYNGVISAFLAGQVQLVKSTALTAIIGFDELLETSNVINNATFAPFTVYGLVALIYFALCYPLTVASRKLERRLALAAR